ncbi:MrcB family domain-containing protein [Streptomyces purpureus]|uniref:MrcB family domain-containing protein n=1 Tax=Streptomyces purpureus TaxID=1951 RepID=UPI00379FF07A
MPLRDLLVRIAETYEPGGLATAEKPGHALLWAVKNREDLPLPTRCFAEGYGGQGTASLTPWVGVFDRAINTNPHDGLYLAYIFNSDRSTVTLTLQQGVTKLIKPYGKGARLHRYLAAQAATLRPALRPTIAGEWRDALHLSVSTKDWRPRAYEKANVAAKRYELGTIPTDDVLTEDLRQAVQLLQDAAAADRFLELQLPKAGEPIVEYQAPGPDHDPLHGFHPKGSEGYYVDVRGGTQRREQPHEALIQKFGHHAAACRYIPLTDKMHPRDLVLRHSDFPHREWLVEAKAVKDVKKTYLAVREAVGQLHEYRHFYYRERGSEDPSLVALFSHDIGPFSEYLETLGIASVWTAPHGWGGSPLAASWGLVV